jgi:hypothetical protein
VSLFSDILISKSRYLVGVRCDKLLSCTYHRKDLFPPHDKATLGRFAQGHEVGVLTPLSLQDFSSIDGH